MLFASWWMVEYFVQFRSCCLYYSRAHISRVPHMLLDVSIRTVIAVYGVWRWNMFLRSSRVEIYWFSIEIFLCNPCNLYKQFISYFFHSRGWISPQNRFLFFHFASRGRAQVQKVVLCWRFVPIRVVLVCAGTSIKVYHKISIP